MKKPKSRSVRHQVAPGRKKKTKTIASLKKDLEALQKAYTVKKYGNDCFTCKQKNLKGANCQLGHVPWPRADISVQARYDYRYTRIQCFRCNIHLGGSGAIAFQKMQLLGIDLNELRGMSEQKKGKAVSRKWFEEKIYSYTFLLSTY